jgi:hypothetical protein
MTGAADAGRWEANRVAVKVLDTSTIDVSVLVAGVVVNPDNVVCDVTIRSGRSRADDGIQPATCTIELVEDDPSTLQVEIAQTLQVMVEAAPRFTGRVTEITRTPAGAASTWTVIGAGRLARLTRFLVAMPLPAETAAARAQRVISALGFTADIHGGANLNLGIYGQAGQPPVTSDQVLGDLIADTGCIIQDAGDGSILVQFLDSRLSEDQWTPDPDLTQLSLDFAQNDDLVNDASVAWTGGTVTASAPGSIATYDRRSVQLSTLLADAASAQARANGLVARLALPAWSVDQATVWDRTILQHQIGAIVTFGPLPAGSPVESPWQGVLEGWVDRYQPAGDGTGRIIGIWNIAVGDLAHSVETIHWGGVTATLHWNGVDPATAWNEAISNAALTP